VSGAVAGRSCGDCSLCCKLLPVATAELSKPAGEWCQHCRPGAGGCSIYERRPPICRNYKCQWLRHPIIDDAWYPKKCGMVISVSEAGSVLAWTITVDPVTPDAWRKPPYLQHLKRLARTGLTDKEQRFLTLVFAGQQRILVLPNRSALLPTSGDEIVIQRTGLNSWEARTDEGALLAEALPQG
jgi:hypothetical protein